MKVDPVCIFHGLRHSEHDCLVCAICYRDLTIEECHKLPDGDREDVCEDCAANEEMLMRQKQVTK